MLVPHVVAEGGPCGGCPKPGTLEVGSEVCRGWEKRLLITPHSIHFVLRNEGIKAMALNEDNFFLTGEIGHSSMRSHG